MLSLCNNAKFLSLVSGPSDGRRGQRGCLVKIDNIFNTHSYCVYHT